MSDLIVNLVDFAMGFFIGAMLEFVAIRTYLLVDPRKRSRSLLALVAIAELMLLFTLANRLGSREAWFGVISSQLFIFNYTIRKFYDPIRDL